MLRSADKLKGAALVATDGAIGEVDDFYFDDERWAVRYLVVNTGTWLAGRTVLVSPISIKQVDVPTNQIFTSLTQRQVENSPGLDAHQPVSRRQEAQLLGYYGYPTTGAARSCGARRRTRRRSPSRPLPAVRSRPLRRRGRARRRRRRSPRTATCGA
jgi:hypothetical protein